MEMERAFMRRLRAHGVRIRVLDEDTAVCRAVPVHPDYFNKARTNVLVKRAGSGLPFLTGVDVNLIYRGADSAVQRLFAAATEREGWRLFDAAHGDFQAALESGLALCGFEGRAPQVAAAPGPGAAAGAGPAVQGVDGFGVNLTRRVRAAPLEQTIGRENEIGEVASCIFRPTQGRLPLVVAEAGAGKSNLLAGVARRLLDVAPGLEVVCVNLGETFAGLLWAAERARVLESLLRRATDAGQPPVVLALEHFELACADADYGPYLLEACLERGGRLIGTTLPERLARCRRPPLEPRVWPVRLPALDPRDFLAMLRLCRQRLAGSFPGIGIDDVCLNVCLKTAESLRPCRSPGRAVALLEAAVARAFVAGARVIGPDDLCVAAEQSRA